MRSACFERSLGIAALICGLAGCAGSERTQGTESFGGAVGSGGAVGNSANAKGGGESQSLGSARAGAEIGQTGGTAGTGGRYDRDTANGGTTNRAAGGTSSTPNVSTGGTDTSSRGTTAAAGGTSSGGSAPIGGLSSGGTTAIGSLNSGGTRTAVSTSSGGTNTGGIGTSTSPRSGGTTSGGNGTRSGTTGVAGSTAQSCPIGKTVPAAGNRRANLTHAGRSRSYILHVPAGLAAGKPLVVVFDLHGAGGSGASQQSQSGWGSTADREGFLVVYPDGVGGYWNVDDTCCGTAGSQKIDDVGFLRAIITQLNQEMCIDARRIYVTGFSNGGGLAHRMGCDAADVIAAIAPVATDLRTQPCNAARPISMLEIRGTADSLEPYAGGLVGPEGGQYLAVGAKASLKLWADINQCTGTTTTMDKYCESYTTCKDGVETDLCSLPGVDHGTYQNSLNFSVSETAWKMFQRQPLR